MIDEELLQELLARASSLYNNGDYQGAIETWNEVLQADPTNTKAREGIQMSHLLIGDLVPEPAEGAGQPPADGGEPPNVALTPKEVETRLGAGVARVKALMAERKFPEALEGAQSLVPIDPGSEEVQRLIEEAQQSFESAPFIEEHLTLARELMDQERLDEAEAECRKVFALDRSNPEAADLLRRMQRAVPPEVEAAIRTKPPAESEDATRREPPLESAGGADEQAGPADSGSADDLELIDIPETGVSDPPIPGSVADGDEDAADPDIIVAKEVVPPAVRMIPPSDDDQSAKERLLEDPTLADRVEEQKDPAEWEDELNRLNLKEGEEDLLGDRSPATDETSVDPAADADLMSLLDEEFSGSEGAIVLNSESDPGGMGAMPADPQAGPRDEPVMEEGGPPSACEIPAAPPMGETAAAPAGTFVEDPVEEMPAEPLREESPEPPAEVERESAPARDVKSEPIRVEGRSSIPKYFALLGVAILLAGGAGWWFLLRPSAAGADGDPGGIASPPAGSPSSPPAGADAGPIPTPIGGRSSRKPAPPRAAAAGVAMPQVEEVVAEPAPEVDTKNIDTKATTALTPREVEQRVEGHLSRGRRLLKQEDWQGVRKEMRAAMALDPFNLEVRDLSDRADAKIEAQNALLREFAEVRRMFDAKDYQGALWKLYRIKRDPALGDIDLYIRNCWYNWAAVSMRSGNNGDALEKIGETLATDPRDAEARNLQGFAERYQSRAKDDIYYAFADSTELRALDEK